MQQIALAGAVGATIAAVAIAGATGSSAAPAASSHSHGGPHWLHASTRSKLVLGADSSPDTSGVSSTASFDPGSQPSSSAGPTSSGTSASTDPDEYEDPEFIDISATPGPCTPDDVDASRWSTRVTVTNPKDVGPLDYVALGVNFDDDSEDQYPQAGPLHLNAGETGSVVLTGPSDYFPDAIIVGGGISSDGLTAKVIGEIDLLDQQDFLKVAKVCGNTTPSPDPYDDWDSTEAASGYPGDGSDDETKTVTATVTVTRTQTVQIERPGMGEPPTPSPITTHLGVTG